MRYCSVCGREQHDTPSGWVCRGGHGGAPEATAGASQASAQGSEVGNFGDSARAQIARQAASLPLPNYATPAAQDGGQGQAEWDIIAAAKSIMNAVDDYVEKQDSDRRGNLRKVALAALEAARSAPRPVLTNEQIIQLFEQHMMPEESRGLVTEYRNGAPIVAFAHAILAKGAPRPVLTEEAIIRLAQESDMPAIASVDNVGTVVDFARQIERAVREGGGNV